MAEKRQRNYAAEFQRRNDLAKQRGFKSYGQQRRYTEYTGTPATSIASIRPEEIAEAYPVGIYDLSNYEPGSDKLLDAWMYRARNAGFDEEKAYRDFQRNVRDTTVRGRRRQLMRMSQRLYNRDWDERWDESAA